MVAHIEWSCKVRSARRAIVRLRNSSVVPSGDRVSVACPQRRGRPCTSTAQARMGVLHPREVEYQPASHHDVDPLNVPLPEPHHEVNTLQVPPESNSRMLFRRRATCSLARVPRVCLPAIDTARRDKEKSANIDFGYSSRRSNKQVRNKNFQMAMKS